MQITYTEEGAEFSGDTGSVTGIAVYEATLEWGLNADIGGRDGWECTSVELICLKIDALTLTPDQLADVADRSTIARAESAVGEIIAANVADYVEAA